LKEAVDHRPQQYPPRRMDPGSRSLCSLVRDDGELFGFGPQPTTHFIHIVIASAAKQSILS
jgi:hypothetical protein